MEKAKYVVPAKGKPVFIMKDGKICTKVKVVGTVTPRRTDRKLLNRMMRSLERVTHSY